MATWEVSVFDEKTEKLVEEFKVDGLHSAEARVLWEVPPGVPPAGEFPVTEKELARLNQLLDRPLHLEPEYVFFIGLHRDYPGEVIEEPDGEQWYPSPGIEAPLALPGMESLTPAPPRGPRAENAAAEFLASDDTEEEPAAMRAITAAEITPGVIFEDCGFHPVLCTLGSVEEDELQGISLIDGQIRTCSMVHCGPELLSLGQVLAVKNDFAAHVAARTAGEGLPLGDDLPAVDASDVMGMAVPVRPYAPETGVRLFWVPGTRIHVRAEGAEVHVKANSAGLLSLASHLLALHQYPVPDGSHVHLDEFSGMDDGSAEVVIERGAS